MSPLLLSLLTTLHLKDLCVYLPYQNASSLRSVMISVISDPSVPWVMVFNKYLLNYGCNENVFPLWSSLQYCVNGFVSISVISESLRTDHKLKCLSGSRQFKQMSTASLSGSVALRGHLLLSCAQVLPERCVRPVLPDLLLLQWKQKNPGVIWAVMIQFFKTVQIKKMVLQAGFGSRRQLVTITWSLWVGRITHATPVPWAWCLVCLIVPPP